MSDPVRRDVVIQATSDRSFAAFVEISQVLAWLADGAVIGPRVGGSWGLGWYADPESDAGYQSYGVFTEFEPGSRFVVDRVVFTTPEGEELGPMTVTVEFGEAGPGSTHVSVLQEGMGDGPEWDAYRAGLAPGWDRSLSDLKAWLEEGRKLPGR